MVELSREQNRINLAVALLQGQLVKKPNDGYDPGGFYRKSVAATVGAALDMAEELMVANEQFGEPDEDLQLLELKGFKEEVVKTMDDHSLSQPKVLEAIREIINKYKDFEEEEE